MKSKNYIALAFLLLISFKILIVPVIYLDFELRKDYIIQNLCENRFKPALKCDGKCYLAKQLQKVAEEKATNEAEKQGQSIKKIVDDVFEELTFFDHVITQKIVNLPSYFYQVQSTTGYIFTLLHPPTI